MFHNVVYCFVDILQAASAAAIAAMSETHEENQNAFIMEGSVK